jgi:hypothetical protein
MPTVALSGTLQPILRTDMLQENLVSHPIPWSRMRTFDSYAVLLPAAPTSDDLGLVHGTVGSNSPMIKSTTASTTTITQKLRFEGILGEDYIPAGRCYIRVHCRVEVAAHVSATIDLNAYESDNQGGISADLVITGATDINNDTWTSRDFVLTATALDVGSRLDVMLTFAAVDTGGTNGEDGTKICFR